MTLDEAIKRCKEKAEELREQIITALDDGREIYDKDCEDCANDHEQLAEWLTELKELRETMEMMKKHYILVEKSPRDNPNDFMVGGVVPDNLQGWRYEEKENDK